MFIPKVQIAKFAFQPYHNITVCCGEGRGGGCEGGWGAGCGVIWERLKSLNKDHRVSGGKEKTCLIYAKPLPCQKNRTNRWKCYTIQATLRGAGAPVWPGVFKRLFPSGAFLYM